MKKESDERKKSELSDDDDNENRDEGDNKGNSDDRQEKKQEIRISNINESGSIITKNRGASIHSLVIAGQIE